MLLKSGDNTMIIDDTFSYELNEMKFVFVPFVPNGRFKEAIDKVDWNDANCIFAHQEFKGCKMGAIVSEDGDDWNDNLPYIISGHIHSKQYVGENIFYPGSAMQHSFGESSENIIPFLHFQKTC